jgi:transcriptional antiterminator NusG
MGFDEPRIKIDFELGEPVKVIRGPFENFSGVIDEISPEKGKIRVVVLMFGRETPVELDYHQVEKL